MEFKENIYYDFYYDSIYYKNQPEIFLKNVRLVNIREEADLIMADVMRGQDKLTLLIYDLLLEWLYLKCDCGFITNVRMVERKIK